MPNRADLAGVKRRKAPHALLASGSRWAATSGCEGRYGAGQAVKEHDCRSICAGPLTRRSSPVVTVLNSPQFHAGSVGADLARRKPGVQIPSPPPHPADQRKTLVIFMLDVSPGGRITLGSHLTSLRSRA